MLLLLLLPHRVPTSHHHHAVRIGCAWRLVGEACIASPRKNGLALRHLGAFPFGLGWGVTSVEWVIVGAWVHQSRGPQALRYTSEVHSERVPIGVNRGHVILLLFIDLLLALQS